MDENIPVPISIVFQIYQHNQNKEPLWYRKLMNLISKDYTQKEISVALDKLMDFGFVEKRWVRLDTGWYQTYHIIDKVQPSVKRLISPYYLV